MNKMTKTYDFETMTREEALDIRVAMDVAKWGECEREASRRLHASRSRGLLINSIVHHESHGYGDDFDDETKKIAEKQLTRADWAELRRGG